MNLFCKCVSLSAICLISFLIITTLNAQKIGPPFDTNKIIEQLHYQQESSKSRADEFLVDTSIVHILVRKEQEYPSIAFDGTNYMVVWEDRRSGTTIDIFGTRITPEGVILDSTGIPFCMSANSQRYPAVAFDGSNYLVVWVESRLHATDYDIYGTRVTPEGVVLDSSGIAISLVANRPLYPSIAFDSVNYLVVWQDYRNDSWDIFGTRVTQTGRVLDSSGIVISTAPDRQEYPSIAFGGTNYIVVWNDCRTGISSDIYCTRITPAGMILDSTGIAISTSGRTRLPSVAFDGLNYFIVWQDICNNSCDIYGARVNQNGAVLDSTGIAISDAANHQQRPSIAFDGTNYLVVWDDYRNFSISGADIYGARVSPSGAVLDTLGIAISTEIDGQICPSIAFDSANYLVVWQVFSYSYAIYDIYGARLNHDGFLLDSLAIPISRAAQHQQYSSVAFDGLNYFVAWQDYRSGKNWDVYGIRIAHNSNILDSLPLFFSSLADSAKHPAIAFDGTNYLVVWEEYRRGDSSDIYGARVTPSGVILDSMGITISTALNHQCYPKLTFDGINYLVVWEDCRSGNRYDIYGARVTQAGEVLDPSGIAISTYVYGQINPSIAFDGINYLVVWSDGRGGPWNNKIYGARVTPVGIVLDPSGIPISTIYGDQCRPSITFDGINYLVVWEDWRNGVNSAIWGARVNPSGLVLDSIGLPISIAEHYHFRAHVTFDGLKYFVAWDAQIDDPLYNNYVYSHLYGALVDTAGIVIDSFVISTLLGNQYQPVTTKGPDNQLLITYTGWTPEPYNTYRIWGKFYPFIGVEEDTKFKVFTRKLGLQIYPNPINKQCNIKYNLPREIKVNISMYDVTGRLVKEITNEKQNVGIYNKIIDVTDLSQGVYFVRFKTKNYLDTKKVIFIK